MGVSKSQPALPPSRSELGVAAGGGEQSTQLGGTREALVQVALGEQGELW